MIRKATEKDIDRILTVTRACAQHMIGQGILQWNDSYPNKSAFLIDIQRGELYALEKNNNIVGCITISTLMDSEYVPIKWLTENKHNLYIHRLAIIPEFQGQGFAQRLMDFAEDFAIKNNYTSIRLDTFSQNKRNQKFYELRGYKKLGSVYFPNQSEHPFYCYELVL
ncbi:GNAT family N-acetyltransferase [Hanstruepera neustonica]|uniref:GNAT family N-acetyltransferase n=1 Tax=Hanstruepera neustonica TaxID=1445657 RepID=A0A2K1E3K0_9FLAO|nr:GNAT family N-acetyltransferase [Hanstruepera neustonica]PNQ74868.1 GNAT family N-acetyltransferase [Hanstruepera neustonica]